MTDTMKKLKIANQITAYIPFLALALFLAYFIQVILNVKYNTFFMYLFFWLLAVSFIFSMPATVILFCVRRFIFKEKISSVFTIFIFTETLLIYLISYNVGNILYYVFD